VIGKKSVVAVETFPHGRWEVESEEAGADLPGEILPEIMRGSAAAARCRKVQSLPQH
jgi:hypothetical protein